MSYFILFISALGAATILPFSSEATLLIMLNQSLNIYWLWLFATLGNTIGAMINWWLGRYMLNYQDKKWFPVSQQGIYRSQKWFQKYGVWSLLMSWLPIIGDALTLTAGFLKVKFSLFLVLTAIGKGARYAFVIAIFTMAT
jgi:membrane protein YqaA with SNARE-associated domain